MINLNDVIIIGHKGGAYKEAPDNSIKAFKKAIEFGADYIEIDIRQTKDGNYVIIHDSNTFKATQYPGVVEEMTLDELKKLDIGEGEKIPSLDEVIKLTKNKIYLMCELKTRNIAEGLINKLKREDMLDSTIFVSFYIDELIKIQKINSEIKLGAIVPITEEFVPTWPQRKDMINEVIKKGLSILLTRFKNVDLQFIEYCHKNDLRVIVYPVKTKIIMRKYINMGIDGMIVKNISSARQLFDE